MWVFTAGSGWAARWAIPAAMSLAIWIDLRKPIFVFGSANTLVRLPRCMYSTTKHTSTRFQSSCNSTKVIRIRFGCTHTPKSGNRFGCRTLLNTTASLTRWINSVSWSFWFARTFSTTYSILVNRELIALREYTSCCCHSAKKKSPLGPLPIRALVFMSIHLTSQPGGCDGKDTSLQSAPSRSVISSSPFVTCRRMCGSSAGARAARFNKECGKTWWTVTPKHKELFYCYTCFTPSSSGVPLSNSISSVRDGFSSKISRATASLTMIEPFECCCNSRFAFSAAVPDYARVRRAKIKK